MRRINLKIIKYITIFAPAIFILAVEEVRHRFFVENDPMTIGNVAIFLVVLIGSYFFSRVTFGIIDRTQKENLRRNKELATLNDVATVVNESLDLEVVMFRALDKMLQIADFKAGEIFLRGDSVPDLVQKVHSGAVADGFHQKKQLHIGEGFAGMLAASGAPLITGEINREDWLLNPKLAENGLGALVGIPLKFKNMVTGVIILATSSPRNISPDDMRLLVSITNQIAVAIENARLHEKVQELAAVEERERIAREMHDGVAQVLSFINVKTQAARQVLASGQHDQADAYMHDIEEIARDSYADVREAILGLRSTDLTRKGMRSMLKDYIMHFSQLSRIKTEVDFPESSPLNLPPDTEIQIIRIVQEALTNVRKHSKANTARVRFNVVDGRVEITIEDDGQGFDTRRVVKENHPQFGLQSMRERAESIKGTLTIDSEPGKGTRVILRVPMEKEAVDAGITGR